MPSRYGPYVVEDEVGRGGMGVVFRARHAQTGAPVALKVLSAARLAGPSERALARFRREAEVLARIAAPGIVRVHAVGVEAGEPWCAMDLVDGRSLADRLRAGPVPPEQAAALVVEVARALELAHARGVVHRDLKPENVLLDAAGRPHLVDFGLAYDALAERLTRTGELLGTPAYMAPEQVARSGSGTGSGEDDVGPLTDVYGLGALLFAALTGEPPFRGGDVPALVLAVIRTEPEPPSGRVAGGLPAALDAICLRALAKEPAGRFASAGALADDLERWARGEPVLTRAPGALSRAWGRLRPRTPAARAAAALLAVAVGVASVAAFASALGGGRDARPRIETLEAALERGGRFAPTEADIALLAAAAEGDDPELAGRAALLEHLAALADPALDAAEVDRRVRVVAALVRPGGAVDRVRLGRAVGVLRGRPTLAPLVAVLHGAEPVAPIDDADLARDLARAAVDGLDAPGSLLQALYRARPLADDDALRGRLLLRHAAVVLAGGADRYEEAFGLLSKAARRHATFDGGAAWPAAFHAWLLARWADAIDIGQLRLARRLDDLIVRVELAPEPVEPRIVVRMQRVVMGASPTESSDELLEQALLVIGVLEARGASPFVQSGVSLAFARFGVERVARRAAAEMGREPAARNPATLASLAALALLGSRPGDTESWERVRSTATPWLEAALQTGHRAPWLDVLAALLFRQLGDRERAIALQERALAAERTRPLARRWPCVPEGLARYLVEQAGGPDAPGIDWPRIATLSEEAARIQVAVLPRLQALAAVEMTGGPWALMAHQQIARLLLHAIRGLREQMPDACCAERAPGVEHPLPARLAEAGIAMVSRGFRASDLRRTRAEHHLRHDRLEEAVAALGEAIDATRLGEPGEGSGDLKRRVDRRRECLVLRAGVLDRLGRKREADRDRARAAGIR